MNKNKVSGLTLVEIIVAVAIIATALILIVSIIPTGILSLKKAEDYQSASSYGMALIEEVKNRRPEHLAYPVTDLDFNRDFNNTTFHFQRDIYAIDVQVPHRLFDIVVTINWSQQPEPITLSTRVYYQE